ncbi:Glutathione S-transferase [Oryctes borbonicus]|uniref:glutathione transferase n=1 Tax=Oryctes borbonicus TaxID=1629725 RepID=A0A0T6AWP3_9SCAR|nr:Glutathione S-transferase [Oryctes borbonicus]
MVLKLYYDLMSQPSRAMFILLNKSDIQFVQCPVALHKGEHLTEKYKNDVSRFRKVPVIDHDGYKLTESIAMLRYLAREKELPDNFYPNDSKKQARVDEFLEWQHNNLRLACSMYFQLKFLIPKMTGNESDEDMVILFESRMLDALEQMESLWLQEKDFINGEQISAADIWAACEIEQPRMAGYEPREGRPKLKAWLDRVRDATNPYYDQAHVILNKVVKKAHGIQSNL